MRASDQRARIGQHLQAAYLSVAGPSSGSRDAFSSQQQIQAAIECLLYHANANGVSAKAIADAAVFQVNNQLNVER